MTDAIVWPGALVIGLLAGAQLPVVFEFVETRLKIDDGCAVFPVHGSAGMLGAVLYPLFATAGFSATQLAVQVLGVVVIGGWTVAATYVVFAALRATGQARVAPDHERECLDIAEHGVDTYPEFGDADTIAADGGVVEGVTDGGVPPADIHMVMGIVRPEKLGAIKTALAKVGAPSLTVTDVSGRGNQPAKTGQWRGQEYTVDLHQKVKVECVVADVPPGDVVEAIREAATTGEPGDGKVFVLPVEDACQVRTGARGTEAV